MIEEFSKSFQAKNKGLYFMVRNVTESECVNMLQAGQVPDLFSCSYGVSNIIKDYLVSFDDFDFDLHENFLEAGKDDNGKQNNIKLPNQRNNYLPITISFTMNEIIIGEENEISKCF